MRVVAHLQTRDARRRLVQHRCLTAERALNAGQRTSVVELALLATLLARLDTGRVPLHRDELRLRADDGVEGLVVQRLQLLAEEDSELNRP